MSNRRPHLLPLDGLRGTAILMVMFYHYCSGGIRSSSVLVRGVSELFGFGWSGVDLFFVLSGFLITGILYDSKDAPNYYGRFFSRRARRIFPAYYLFALVCLMVVPFGTWRLGHLSFLVYLGYPVALIWPTLVTTVPVHLSHLWSLSIEEQFYAVWPWLVRRIGAPSSMLKLCGALCITALLLRMILAGHGGWYFGFILCRMDCLAVGAAAAMLQRLKVKIPAWSIFLFAFGVVAAICVLRHTTDHADIWIGTIGFTAIAVAYGALLVLSLDPLSWLFSNAVLRFFGKYSYGLYLYHYPLTSVTDRFKPLSGHFPLGSSVAYVGGCMAINVAIAMLSFHLLEQPIRNWRRGARGQP